MIRNGEFIVDNIEFRNARVADGNGAGIRFERGRLEVLNSHFIDNQNGILTANQHDAELVIRDSLFADAPHPNLTLPHLLYVGKIARLELTGNRFHNGYEGHLIKSRARERDPLQPDLRRPEWRHLVRTRVSERRYRPRGRLRDRPKVPAARLGRTARHRRPAAPDPEFVLPIGTVQQQVPAEWVPGAFQSYDAER